VPFPNFPHPELVEGRTIELQFAFSVLRFLREHARRETVAAVVLLLAFVFNSPSRAETLTLSGALEQGGLVHGKTAPGAQVVLDGRPLRLAPDGSFIFGFGRDAPATARLDVVYPDGRQERRDLAVATRTYDVQRIDGLPPQQVTPDPQTLERIKREAGLIATARGVDSDLPYFAQSFVWPALGPISGVYGSQRILNGEPRAPHMGLDIAAPRGSPVLAAAAGTVTLAERDLFFTGGTVILDHGYGLATTYQHMDSIEVSPGQRVAAGERIGTVGATGRVTGPHLHWALNWYDVRLDPALVMSPMPAAQR
jgi:peptidase M23-like protein